jgi:hypothetical protein
VRRKLPIIVIHISMKKNHLKYLAVGTIFWGSFIGLIIKLIPANDILPLHVLLFEYVIFTVFFVLLVQFSSGGFPLVSPKKCFFIPVAVWVIVGVWGTVEGLFLGSSFSFFDIISR